MNRTGLLAAIAVMLASSPSFAQMGGGMGGMGGGMGGFGGGMGGQAMTPGMMMQGGRVVGARFSEVQRSAQVEMEGGQHLSGKIDLTQVVVEGDLGRYVIAPYKIKAIRFLKPADEVKPVNGPEGNINREGDGVPQHVEEAGRVGDEAVAVREVAQVRPALRRVNRVGGGAGGFGGAPVTRGKVITTSGKEIIGTIHTPTDFRLELEFGLLAVTTDKLRSITFMDDTGEDKPAKAGATGPGARHDLGGPAPDREATLPRYFRVGSTVIIISPVGDRITLYSFETKKAESLELSGSKDAPLEVTPVVDSNLVALMLKGPKVSRIAVADTVSGTWHSQELRKPIEGRATPIVASGVVVYSLGRNVYAYGAEAQRWDVAELPDGVHAIPTVGPGIATIESDGHIYTFAGKTGKWDHLDVRAILDGGAAERK
jgi:hypothetical protein